MRTWATWQQNGDEGPVDLEHYEAGNTVKESLNRHADEALNALSESDRDIAKRLFQALTKTDAGNRGIRRPMHLHQIAAIAKTDTNELIRMIHQFRSGGRNFLGIANLI